jgi:hypothetical protein
LTGWHRWMIFYDFNWVSWNTIVAVVLG